MWIPYSETKLTTLEQQILTALNRSYEGWYVTVNFKDEQVQIWTIAFNRDNNNVPLILLHGFGAGVALWCLNLDDLSIDRPVYAIDILGFGRSSRPNFSKDSLEAENELIESIEEWRKVLKLPKFILLGHSMGAFLATSYSITYPNNVHHLILVDPWGFTERNDNYKPPMWLKLFYPFSLLNPLSAVRFAGPLGPWILKIIRSDIAKKYSTKLDDYTIISEYIYQCNSQKPSGETAFHSMMKHFGWAKNPMVNRINNLTPDIGINVIFGINTWVDTTAGEKLIEQRSNSYIKLEFIEDAGHHVHADNYQKFNEIVKNICKNILYIRDEARLNI